MKTRVVLIPFPRATSYHFHDDVTGNFAESRQFWAARNEAEFAQMEREIRAKLQPPNLRQSGGIGAMDNKPVSAPTPTSRLDPVANRYGPAPTPPSRLDPVANRYGQAPTPPSRLDPVANRYGPAPTPPQLHPDLARLAEEKQKALAYIDTNFRDTKGWSKIQADRLVCSDSSNLGAALLALNGPDDVLYIVGHCTLGAEEILSPDETLPIGVDGLIALLKGRLIEGYKGSIKIYGCQSGLPDAVKGTHAFAQTLTDAMYVAGWKSCRFFGYEQKVSTSRHGEGKDNHKRATMGSGVTAESPRAQTARREMFPTPQPKKS